MQKYINPKPETWSELLKRPTLQFNQIEDTVQSIFKEVQLKGDAAIQKYTAYLDGVSLSNTAVSPEEMEEAFQSVPSDLKEAIATAKQNIEAFHAAQKTTPVRVETQAGVVCWQESPQFQHQELAIFSDLTNPPCENACKERRSPTMQKLINQKSRNPNISNAR